MRGCPAGPVPAREAVGHLSWAAVAPPLLCVAQVCQKLLRNFHWIVCGSIQGGGACRSIFRTQGCALCVLAGVSAARACQRRVPLKGTMVPPPFRCGPPPSVPQKNASRRRPGFARGSRFWLRLLGACWTTCSTASEWVSVWADWVWGARA
jgi:hypothetical protein